MNLAIRGIEADLGDANADTFHNDLHPDLKANYILANPPCNIRIGVVIACATTSAGPTAHPRWGMRTMPGCNT
jgi:hypothetical protein